MTKALFPRVQIAEVRIEQYKNGKCLGVFFHFFCKINGPFICTDNILDVYATVRR